jgi:uncharacterized membrane protein YozB (DUF420 family)
MIAITDFPAINATLNATSAVLLFTGRRLIARKQIQAHKRTMIAAFITSSLFLCCYVYYHSHLYYYEHIGPHRFTGPNPWRAIYLTILFTHTILAIAIVPMILMSLSRGLKRQDARHRAIARYTYPIWLYVSVTGVVIYVMLYRIPW